MSETERDYPTYSGRLDAAERREFLPFVHELADIAASIIRGYFMAAPADYKADNTPVTIADKRAEDVMRSLIMQRYPDHGILGEEWGMHQPNARYRWLLDPIDGTKAFVTHSFLFGTLISLARDGQPILGCISHPLTGHVIVGEGGGPCLLAGQPVKIRPCPQLSEATVLATDHWQMMARPDAAGFESLARQARMYRSWADCHGYFLVATGGADVMFDPILKPWDIFSFVPVIEGAGGRATSIDGGNPLVGTDMVASSPSLHPAVVKMLAESIRVR